MKILSALLLSLLAGSAFAENHNFVLFGAQNTFGIHLSMDMQMHRFQTVARFRLDDGAGDFQARLSADRANHPGRNYLLNPIEKNSLSDLFFELSDFTPALKFDASVYYCDTPVIWNTCFDTWKIFVKRSQVSVEQVYVNTVLVSGTPALQPARYQVIRDGEAKFAYPLMTDLAQQFDQVLAVQSTGSSQKTAFSELVSTAGKAARLRPGAGVQSADGSGFKVLSELLFIDNMP
jgi:hypothetical protein